ncbi:hypothetical protein ABPG72_004632 [Tetrahymena utriculariae]
MTTQTSIQNFKTFHSRIFSASTQRRASDQNAKIQFSQAAMTSIYKGIKNNDISYILGSHNRTATQGFLPQLNKTEEPVDVIEIDEKSDLKRRLVELRRKHDILKNKANKNETDIEKLKQENKALIDEEELLNTQKEGVFKEEGRLREEQENTTFLMQEAEWTKKSYLFMKDRLKRDKIVNQLKQQAIEEELSIVRKCYQQADYQSQMSKQFSDNAQRILDEMLKNVENEKNQIDNKLSSFKNQLIMWEENEKKKLDRSFREKEIAEHAIYDKDAQEKKLRALLLVHKFVSGMLKDKMEREMQKFQVVEESFQKIKTATGQTEMKNIVSKFITREQTYGELLGQIANHEKKIDYIKKRNEGLENELVQLKQDLVSMEQQIVQKKNKGGNKHHEYLKQIDNMDERRKLAELMKEKLHQFCIRILTKFDKVMNEFVLFYIKSLINFKIKKVNKTQPKKYSEEYGKQQIKQAFQQVYTVVMQELKESEQNGDIDDILSELEKTKIEKETQKEEFQRKNIRIKPTQTGKLNTSQSRDSSSNSKSTPNNSFYESDSDTNVDDKNEQDYFDFLRDARKNEDGIIAKKIKHEKEKEQSNNMPPLRFQSPQKQQ